MEFVSVITGSISKVRSFDWISRRCGFHAFPTVLSSSSAVGRTLCVSSIYYETPTRMCVFQDVATEIVGRAATGEQEVVLG